MLRKKKKLDHKSEIDLVQTSNNKEKRKIKNNKVKEVKKVKKVKKWRIIKWKVKKYE